MITAWEERLSGALRKISARAKNVDFDNMSEMEATNLWLAIYEADELLSIYERSNREIKG